MSHDFPPANQSYSEFYENQEELNGIYRIVCHSIPFFTLPIYLEAFYCIFYKCKQFSPKYVTILKIHMFLHFLGEVHWTVLLLPVIILPGMGVSADGLLSYFGISAKWQMFAMCAILNISTATMVHLLIYRLKFAIPPDATNLRMIKISADLINVFYYIVAVLCSCAFAMLNEDQKVAKERMLEKFLVPPPNLWAPNYVTTDRENPNFKYFLYITCGEIFIFSLNIISIPSISFYYLSQNRTEKSEKVAAAHRKTLRTLLFQLAVHCIFHLLPFICFTSAAILKSNNLYFLGSGLAIWALHGAACTLTLLLANGPFRQAMSSHLETIFCCLCFKNRKQESTENRRESTVIQKIDLTI